MRSVKEDRLRPCVLPIGVTCSTLELPRFIKDELLCGRQIAIIKFPFVLGRSSFCAFGVVVKTKREKFKRC